MWHSWGCSCGCTFSPIIYEEGSIHMDQHVFDQWNFSHAIWGFALGAVTHAPRSVEAWKIGFLFVLWEFWENVVEVAFSTYAPGQYMGDSVVNSAFDMIPPLAPGSPLLRRAARPRRPPLAMSCGAAPPRRGSVQAAFCPKAT
ncbi:hypothetical protein JL722_7491 [Aureococcus anophagefferens]|nr:hypothetical protein JL722_7491 [Aureococcus anophagefferens]